MIGPSFPTLTELSADTTTSGAAPQVACGDESAAIPASAHLAIPRTQTQLADVDRMLVLFRPHGLDLDAAQDIARQLSRLLLHQLPYNVDAAETANRKAMFIAAAQLGAERSFILGAHDCLRAGIELSAHTQARLDRLDARYGGDGSISELLRRVSGYVVQVEYLVQEQSRPAPVEAAGTADSPSSASKPRPELTAAVARAVP